MPSAEFPRLDRTRIGGSEDHRSGTAVLANTALASPHVEGGELFLQPRRFSSVEADMFCTRCGVVLQENDRFCSQCGNATPLGRVAPGERMRLTRDIANKKIAGVCAGFARYLNTDVVLVRVLWLSVAICTGVGFLAYLAAWIIMPKQPRPFAQPLEHMAPGTAH
jgi:phage shock protein C